MWKTPDGPSRYLVITHIADQRTPEFHRCRHVVLVYVVTGRRTRRWQEVDVICNTDERGIGDGFDGDLS